MAIERSGTVGHLPQETAPVGEETVLELAIAITPEMAELLECVLGQWTDFAFIPSPKEFVMYADHDEYTTIFARSAESLSALQTRMENKGFKAVTDWTWTGPRSPGVIDEGEDHV